MSIMNDTKWNEIRKAMLWCTTSFFWRTIDVATGYISEWDGEWFYHFSIGGYESTEYLEISFHNDREKMELLQLLRKIHVPGKIKEHSIFVFGCIEISEAIDYLWITPFMMPFIFFISWIIFEEEVRNYWEALSFLSV
jgi:hypothetical protein